MLPRTRRRLTCWRAARSRTVLSCVGEISNTVTSAPSFAKITGSHPPPAARPRTRAPCRYALQAAAGIHEATHAGSGLRWPAERTRIVHRGLGQPLPHLLVVLSDPVPLHAGRILTSRGHLLRPRGDDGQRLALRLR